MVETIYEYNSGSIFSSVKDWRFLALKPHVQAHWKVIAAFAKTY